MPVVIGTFIVITDLRVFAHIAIVNSTVILGSAQTPLLVVVVALFALVAGPHAALRAGLAQVDLADPVFAQARLAVELEAFEAGVAAVRARQGTVVAVVHEAGRALADAEQFPDDEPLEAGVAAEHAGLLALAAVLDLASRVEALASLFVDVEAVLAGVAAVLPSFAAGSAELCLAVEANGAPFRRLVLPAGRWVHEEPNHDDACQYNTEPAQNTASVSPSKDLAALLFIISDYDIDCLFLQVMQLVYLVQKHEEFKYDVSYQ